MTKPDYLQTLTEKLEDYFEKMTHEEYSERVTRIKAKKLGGPTGEEYMKLLTDSMAQCTKNIKEFKTKI